jgi:hypothetical protein
MKKINIGNKYAIVDDEDFEHLNKFHWFLSNRGYAYRSSGGKSLLMHKEVLVCDEGKVVDHINGDKLDNRRSNLRQATHAENMRNRKMQVNNKSGFRGVHQKKKDGLWYAQIKVNGIQKFLGSFKNPLDASVAYEKESQKEYGEFRRI